MFLTFFCQAVQSSQRCLFRLELLSVLLRQRNQLKAWKHFFPIQLRHAISILEQFIVRVCFYNTLDLPFVLDSSAFRQHSSRRKHPHPSRLRQCRLFLQEDRELLADCFYRKLADCFYRKLADYFYRKFEKREAKGEIGRDVSQRSHQGHQR